LEERKLESKGKARGEKPEHGLKGDLAAVISDVNGLVSMQQRRLNETGGDSSFGRTLMKKLDYGESFKPKKLIKEVGSRILAMKSDNRSDFDINEMITDVKGWFTTKNYAKTMKTLPLFNGTTAKGFKAASARQLAQRDSQRRVLVATDAAPVQAKNKISLDGPARN
jgi:hypothetical protein